MVITKTLPNGCSKTTYYTFLANWLCDIARSEGTETIWISPDFTPVLTFAGVEKNRNIPLEGDYEWGAKNNFHFMVSRRLVRTVEINSYKITVE